MSDSRRWTPRTWWALSLLLLAMTWTPLSAQDGSASLICLTATEFAQLEADAQAELQRTAIEAVAAATRPLLTEIAGLRVERDGYRVAEAEARAVADAETARADRETRRKRAWRWLTLATALLGFGAGALLS